MASEVYNLWQTAATVTPLGTAQAANAVWHSGNIDASPAADKQHLGVEVHFSFSFNAAPSGGEVVKFFVCMNDENGLVDGNLGASASEITTAATVQAFLDSVTYQKQITTTGTNAGPYVGSFKVYDVSPDWQLAIHTDAALAASPTLSYRYFDSQGQ